VILSACKKYLIWRTAVNENDADFINEVADYYDSTIDEAHPKGNISAVAEHFGITRGKVNKILITAGTIDSPLHQDIMKLKNEGFDVNDIAQALGVSTATVKANMPYEKVIYNSTEKSAGAAYTEKYRKREKVFLDKLVRKPTDLELFSRELCIDPGEHDHMAQIADNIPDDTLHLNPAFTAEESKLFKISPDIGLIHIELQEDYSRERELVGLKYGNSVSRDLLVPLNLPLHNLHYALNQAFGFTNSHLHRYELNRKDLQWVTDGKAGNWKKLIGIVFKDPLRDRDLDCWDDDYESGSPKKWMRSKYTGPYYRRAYEENYPSVRRNIRGRLKVNGKTIDDLKGLFEDPFDVNEVVPVGQILDFYPEDGGYKSIQEYYEYTDECVEDAADFPDNDIRSQPYVYSFASELIYSYDFGNDWQFTIRPMTDISYLLKDKRVTMAQVKEAIRRVCILARPVLLAADGRNLIDDVDGIEGYLDFLKSLEGKDGNTKDYKQLIHTYGWKPYANQNTV